MIALVVVLVVGLGTAAWHSFRPTPGPSAADATVTASSTALGRSPRAVVTGGGSDGIDGDGDGAAGSGWQSANETTGAWLELAWPQPRVLRRIVLVRPLDDAGVSAGVLSFSDGSSVQVRFSPTSARTVLPISPRAVDRVRFTATAVDPGAAHVTMSRFLADGPSGDDPVPAVPPDGDVAPLATVTASGADGAGEPHVLVDGAASGTGADWTVPRPAGVAVDLRWDSPRELASVSVVGRSGSPSRIAAATLTFSDGATLPVGTTEGDRPTVVAFLPRVTTSVRLRVDRVTGSGPLELAEVRATPPGVTPRRDPVVPDATGPAAPVLGPPVAVPPCAPGVPVAAGIVVRCPASGATVGDRVPLEVGAAPGYTAVTATAWPGDPTLPPGTPAGAAVDPTGTARPLLDAGPAVGPFAVEVTGTGPGVPPVTVHLQLERPASGTPSAPSEPAATGRTLVYDDEFDRPVTASRTGAGADYAAAKPTASGAADFGDAGFADPAAVAVPGSDHLAVGDGLLRLGVRPTSPTGGDPAAALLASARPGGSGFSAQYGYFEARMLVPAARGTWPAFWMLSGDNLVAPAPAVAEIDAVELYGHDPTGACQSTHDYRAGRDTGVGQCGPRFDDVRDALAWHTYGVAVAPTGATFTVDGRVVAVAPPVAAGGMPLFFLVDLALGGGWPVDLAAVGNRATLYVDYVRVFV